RERLYRRARAQREWARCVPQCLSQDRPLSSRFRKRRNLSSRALPSRERAIRSGLQALSNSHLHAQRRNSDQPALRGERIMDAENVNLISVGSRFEGTVEFNNYTRFEGYIRGNLKGASGSKLVLGENGVVEGNVDGDEVIVDGFVRGDIKAS